MQSLWRHEVRVWEGARFINSGGFADMNVFR
jgi:hypothetical protein